MTMYLSNQTVRATGYELVEFVDAPPTPPASPAPADAELDGAAVERIDEPDGSS